MENQQLPIHLQYRRDEDVVRAEHDLSQIVEATARKLATSNHLQAKQLAEQHMMPILAHMIQFFSIQNADFLRFVTSAFLHQAQESETPDTLVGIPPEDAEAMAKELERVLALLERVIGLGGRQTSELEAVKAEAKELRQAVKDLASSILEYALDLEDDDEDDEDMFEISDEEPPEESIVEGTDG